MRKTKKILKYKKGGRWMPDWVFRKTGKAMPNFGFHKTRKFLPNWVFRKKEPSELNFRNAMTECDADCQEFRKKINEVEENRTQYKEDYTNKLKFFKKNNRIQNLDEDDLNEENYPDIIPEVTANTNKKIIQPTYEDKMVKQRNRTTKRIRFGEDKPFVFEEGVTIVPNVSRVYKTNNGYGGRKNKTRKRRFAKK